MLFTELGLSEPILRAVAEEGYTVPTPIQAQAIPAVLGGGDLLAGAQTGTGKTAGFMLPILQRLCDSTPPARADKRKPVRVLILTPTRELAAQVEESARIYGKYVKFSSAVIFGGVGMQPQINTLRRGVDILVATPGRLLDLHQQRVADLSTIEIFVLDEADRMLDMGFIHDIRKVLAVLPAQVNGKPRQNLLFSATFSDDIKALADRLLNKPALIQATPPNAAAPTVEHKMHPVDRDRKGELLVHLVRKNNWQQALVFTRMKHGANKVAEMLEKNGISAMAIHGNKSQTARTKALADFKAGKLQVLVATDIAARGIDIEQLPQVVNYDLPNVPEDYVHRIGRTGRAGSTGQAVSLVTIDETNFLNDIQRLIKHVIPSEVIAGFELDPNAKPEPIVLGRQVLHGAKGSGAGGRGRSGGGGGGAGGRGRSAKPAPQSGYAKPNDPRAPAGRSHAPRPASTSPAKPAQGFSGNRAPSGGGNGGGNGGGAGGNRSAGAGQRSAGGGGAGNGQARHSGAPRRSGSGA